MADVHQPGAGSNGPPIHTELVLQLSWPVLALLLVIFVSSVLLAAIPFLSPTHEAVEIAQAIARGSGIIRMLALIVIVPAISILSMLDKVNGSAAIAALSAIAGYVLGGTTPQ